MWRIFAALLLLGCGGAERAVHEPALAAASVPVPAAAHAVTPRQADELFPERPQGWESVPAETIPDIQRFATEYAEYLGKAKTPRRAVAGLIELMSGRAVELAPGDRPRVAPGSRFYFASRGRDAAAFVLLGRRPIEEGARIIVVAVDAPRIDLKPRPVYDAGGLVMLDTVLYGNPRLESWLSRPLALHVHVARPGAADGPIDIVVGEAPGDPALVIPDLLPHLSRNVQRRTIVDSPERMDAIAARTREALARFLAGQGVDEGTLAEAEASLVPAGPPVFVGLDRALLAGHGNGNLALAYAAVRALADAASAESTAVVVAVSLADGGSEWSNGASSDLGFVKVAMSRVIAAFGEPGEAADALDTRRIYARSAALAATRLDGAPGKGLILSPLSDDSVPAAHRRAISVFERAGAGYQIRSEGGWGPSRALSGLDMDVIDVAIPATGRGAPSELVSTLDLYHAWLASKEWLTTS